MHARSIVFPAAVAALLFAAGSATADLSRADKNFLEKAAQGGEAEVMAGKLAQTNAGSDAVKNFASKMVEDHTKSGEELKALAALKNVKLPQEPSMAQKTKLKALGDDKGEKFDQRYVESFGVEAHEDMLKLFRDEGEKARDPDVKAFAQKTLPTVKHHLDMAKTLKGEVARK